MTNMEKNQENLNKNPQGQGGRTEETREGRETMRGTGAGEQNRQNLSSRDESEMDEDDFEDTEEASFDSSEDEEDASLEGTEKSDLGFNRGRDTNREQSDRV